VAEVYAAIEADLVSFAANLNATAATKEEQRKVLHKRCLEKRIYIKINLLKRLLL
jgi:hypothetical protein